MGMSYRDFFLGLISGFLITILVIVALFAGMYFLTRKMVGDLEKSAATLPAPEFPAPDKLTLYGQADRDWTVRSLDGKNAKLADFEGKVVFLNFWATWCAPCVVELPNIQKLQASLKNDPVVFLLVTNEEEETVRNFIKKKSLQLPIYLQRGPQPAVFKTTGVPATFILAPDGVIVFKRVGSAGWDDPSTATFLRALLKLPSAPSPAPARDNTPRK
jgi:thiol-disulfide isomerase/thioredoxin